MDNLSGTTIKGYKIKERIGAGGFGTVYRTEQRSIFREVAVKAIFPGHANKLEFIRRFENEAQIIARLEHLHITPLYDYWREPDGAYLVMRFMRGGSLENVSFSPDGRMALSASRDNVRIVISAILPVRNGSAI